MGKEIAADSFSPSDLAEFTAKLREETALIKQWGKDGRFASAPLHLGCELECCLTRKNFLPAPVNHEFLHHYRDDDATVEVARFNVEFNPRPLPWEKNTLLTFRRLLDDLCATAAETAAAIDTRLLMTGLLPTLSMADFADSMLTDRPRYRAFQQRLRELNRGRLFRVEIGSGEGLVCAVSNLAIEGAATSLQVHLQTAEEESAAIYNAAQVATAPVLAAGANSPFFMGKHLWAETRVALFEQVLHERFPPPPSKARTRRRDDFFGLGYLSSSMLELFALNFENLPPLLPVVSDGNVADMAHLTLHNGTIWRWNRPVLGFASDGSPTIRIEHRSLPAGPTAADITANTALFVGLSWALREHFAPAQLTATAAQMPFARTRTNFYTAARDGLDAQLHWLDGRKYPVRMLLAEKLLPLAQNGLEEIGVDKNHAADVLSLIAERVRQGQNGATWQRDYVHRHGDGMLGMVAMTEAYWHRQQSGAPVHEWTI